MTALDVLLLEDLTDVILDRLLTDDEAGRNLTVGCTSLQLLKDLKFTWCQVGGICLRSCSVQR